MNPESPDFHQELENFPELYDTFSSVVTSFIFHKSGGNLNSLIKKGDSWVCDPNFVTFRLHYKLANKTGDESKRNITVDLRGNVHEYASEHFPHLPLQPAQNGYCRCKVKSLSQLDGLMFYLGRAYELYSRGSTREKLSQNVIEK